MAQSGIVIRVSTDPSAQFRAAIAQNAAAYLDVALPEGLAAGRAAKCRLRSLLIASVENIGWEVWLFRRSRTGAEVIGDIQAVGFWTFTASMAVRIGGAGLYYQYVDGLDVPYEVTDVLATGAPDDAGQRRNLHMALVAREAGKSADDAGAVAVQMVLEPTLGW